MGAFYLERPVFRSKVIRGETKALDAAGRIEAVVSNETEDRDGDVIRAAGWVLDAFERHPVLLSSHNYASLRSQIGEWESMKIRGKKLIGVARYYIGEGNEEADWGFKLAAKGRAAYSVGFVPLEYKEREASRASGMMGSYEFTRQELLEVSHVTIPSNPDALQLMAKMLPAATSPVAEIVAELLAEQAPIVKQEMGPCVMPGCDSAASVVVSVCKDCLAAMMRGPAEVVIGASVKGPIPPHEGPKADEGAAWDAAAEVRQAEGRAQLRRMHAWVDDDGEADAKSSYKLPHHQASGEVVWRGVAAAMAALMGGRGGVDIPADDRRGVYRHLTRHYDQFDKEPPEFKAPAPPLDAVAIAAQVAAAIRENLRRST